MADSIALLSGKVALVTGAGRGIGRSIATALSEAGAAVVLMARSANEVAETTDLIQNNGGRGIGMAADVSDRSAIERCVHEATSELGPIDILVNNAGVIGPETPLWETDPDDWWRAVEINLRGPLLMSRAVLPAMIERRAGVIINVGSYAGTHANIVASGSYTTSKAALMRLTDSLAAATEEFNVRVFTISPGLVHTLMTDSSDRFNSVPEELWSPIEATGKLIIRLVTIPGTDLNGKFIHVNDDLDELLREAERIKAEELYTLRLVTLRGPA